MFVSDGSIIYVLFGGQFMVVAVTVQTGECNASTQLIHPPG